MMHQSSRTTVKLFTVLLILMLAFAALPADPVAAASLGPNYPDTGTNSGTGTAWSDTGSIVSNNDDDAYVDLASGHVSQLLVATDFDFAIPSGSTIQGIQVVIGRMATGSTIRDSEVRLVKNGTTTGNNKAITSEGWPTNERTISYGGASDLWGTTWTAEDINANNFGVVLSVRNTSSSNTRRALVDYIRITLTYIPEAKLTATDVTGVYGNSTTLSATISPAFSGAAITFRVNGTMACSDTTNSSGVASCSTLLTTNVGVYPSGVQASFAGNSEYLASSDTASLTVNARPISVTAATGTKTYDGTTASSGTPTVTSGSLLTGQTAAWTQTYNNKNAGTGKTITPSGTVNDGNGGANYAVTFVPVTNGVINQRPISVTAATDTKTYDGTTASSATPSVTSGTLAAGETATWSQTYDNKDADTGKTLTPAGAVNDDNDGANYVVTFTPVSTGVINRRPISVSAKSDTKTYDGTPSSDGKPELTSGTLVTGETAAFTQVFDSKHIGVDKILTPSGSVSDGNGGANYVITFVAVHDGEITPRNITVTAAPDTKTYDKNTTSEAKPILTGEIAPGDNATWSQAFEDVNAGTGKQLIPTGTIVDGNDGKNYTVTFTPATDGVIEPREITVTAVTETKVYDGSNAAAGLPEITSGALVEGDTAGWAQAFDNKNAGTGKSLMPSGTVEDGNKGANYKVTFAPVSTGAINPREITVTAETDSKTYDGTPSSDGQPTITAGMLVAGETAAWSQAFENKDAGTGKSLLPSGSVADGNAGDNYDVTFVADTTGVIEPLAITVTAHDRSKTYGEADPDLTYDVEPALMAGDKFTGKLAREDGLDVGVYLIDQGSLTAGSNYTITFVGAELTINIADQTITITTHAPASALNGSTFTVAAAATSGLDVTYSAEGVCTNDGPAFTMTSSAGTCTVLYDQAGDKNHNPAPQLVEAVEATNAPVVTLHPEDVGIRPGEDAVFMALADGNPVPTVKWQVSTDGGSTFEDMDGETDLSLTIPGATVEMNGYQYRAVFTNSSGEEVTEAAALRVMHLTFFLTTVSKQ